MKPRSPRTLPALLSTFVLAPALAQGPSPAPATPPPSSAVAEQRDVCRTVELDGTFVPRAPAELGVWLEEWSGELVLAEVLPHGSFVNQGDVVARFDTRRIDEEIESAKHDLVTAEAAHALAEERAEQEAEVAAERLDDARYALERARTELEGWERYELDFRRRGEELSAQRAQDGLADQQHELEQLEAMYAADELVEATEEIVLARSRRDVARARLQRKLGEDREEYARKFELPAQDRAKRMAATRAQAALARLERLQSLEARTRADGLERSARGVAEKREKVAALERDHEALALRAPSSGLLLHGGRKDYGPGRTRPQHEIGGRAQAKTALFSIAAPEALDVVVAVPETKLAEVRGGIGATVRPLALAGSELVGRLELARHPLPGNGAEAQIEGRIVLERAPVGVVPGMHGKVALAVEPIAAAVVVPAAAVQGRGADAHAWVRAESGEYVRRTVEIGATIGGDAVVRAGIAPGEHVLLGEPAP